MIENLGVGLLLYVGPLQARGRGGAGVEPPCSPPQARSQGGGGGSGGSYDPPQLPIPKILFHPLAILFHPLAILFHLSAILFHPLAILFHPSAILFHPWNMDDVTRAMSKGGGVLVNVQEGAFFKLMTSHGQCPRGGACECPRGGVFQVDDVTRAMSKGGCL